MKKLSIIIPCYNEEETIRPFLEVTKVVENQMAEEVVFDYIFVNDGSKDATLEVLREVSREFENVHYLSFSRNFGIPRCHMDTCHIGGFKSEVRQHPS